jgi:hypothetical protein
MARHKDADWVLPDRAQDWTQVGVAVLMDIRDELKALNSKLDCWRVRRMLDTVERIDRRLAKRVSLKRGK